MISQPQLVRTTLSNRQHRAPSRKGGDHQHKNLLLGFWLLPWSGPSESHTWTSWPGPSLPSLPPPGTGSHALAVPCLGFSFSPVIEANNPPDCAFPHRLSRHPHSHRNHRRKGSVKWQGWFTLQPSHHSIQYRAVPFGLHIAGWHQPWHWLQVGTLGPLQLDVFGPVLWEVFMELTRFQMLHNTLSEFEEACARSVLEC